MKFAEHKMWSDAGAFAANTAWGRGDPLISNAVASACWDEACRRGEWQLAWFLVGYMSTVRERST